MKADAKLLRVLGVVAASRFLRMLYLALLVAWACPEVAIAGSARQQNPSCSPMGVCDEVAARLECEDELSLAKKDPGLQPWVQSLICVDQTLAFSITNPESGYPASLNDYQNGFPFLPSESIPLRSTQGAPCKGLCFGDPINGGSGNKYEIRTEFQGEGIFPLMLQWTYNSHREPAYHPKSSYVFGRLRTHSYQRRVDYYVASDGPAAYVLRSDGRTLRFRQQDGIWVADRSDRGELVAFTGSSGITGWQFTDPTGEKETFDTSGKLLKLESVHGFVQTLRYDTQSRLQSVTDPSGRTLGFVYNADNMIKEVMIPGGGSLRFGYTSEGDLATVQYPDLSTRQYLYDEASYVQSGAPTGALTGVIDESNQRNSTTTYEKSVYSSWARALSTYQGDHQAMVSGSYQMADGEVYATQFTVTESLGATRQVDVGISGGDLVPIQQVTSCTGCPTSTTTFSYDAIGQIDRIDHNGETADYDYDASGRLLRVTEADNNSQGVKRSAKTDWHSSFRVPVERRFYDSGNALVSKETWTYNTRGQTLAASRTDPIAGTTRTSTTTYCEQIDLDVGTCPLLGLTTLIDGPRSDVTDRLAYMYYSVDDTACSSAPITCPHRKGDLWKVTNALGQVTEYLSYDGAGRLLSVKDANGTITDYTYHPRGWLTASKVRGADDTSESDDRITLIDYWPTGLVKQVTQPDGAFTAFTYDAAHRLTDIADNAGNALHYTLDNAGNRVKEDTKDASGTLKRTLSRVYNQLGQLATQATASGEPTDFGYDANGNTTTVTDALGHKTQNDYDPLNRLASTLQDVGGIAAETKFGYDALDNLTKVTDPKGLDTTYAYNGLGDLTKLTSPDTGVTTYTYDNAGNRATQTDARNIKTTYSYDALNRLTKLAYPTTSLNVSYTYDVSQTTCASGETYAIGRLARMQVGSGSIDYCYDRFGDLVRKVQTTNGKVFVLRYAYTKAGQLSRLTYPDGAAVDYVRNAQGQTTEVGVTPAGGTRQVLLNNAAYYPFGPVASWSYGNGRPMQRVLDQDYRPLAINDTRSDGLSTGFAFDPAGNLSALTAAGNTAPVVSLDYDALGRLTAFKDGPTGTVIDGYSYDATGNRLSAKVNTATQSYTYPTTSHRLSAVAGTARTYDAIGNTLSIGGTAQEFAYDATGRMSQAKRAGTVVMKYVYNGRGEQVRRVDKTNTYTLYDESGHWLGNYDANGATLQQAIWLDDLPVGVLAKNSVRYVQPDHLGSPRAVIDPTRDVAIWKWDMKGEAFGNTSPDQDPDKDGTAFVFDMRFPGQRYDAATGFNQNYFRDYDPGTGRYGQTDPIGLRAGPSIYAYTNADPTTSIDPYGLQVRAPSSHTWRQNSGGYSNIKSVVPYTPPGVNIPLGFSVHDTISSYWESAAISLVPWDYTMYCIDVWCMRRKSEGQCSISDEWEREGQIGGYQTLINVMRRGCQCRKALFGDQLPKTGPDQAEFMDALEIAARLRELQMMRR
ncbi:DUF6531 domain-containing protein [Xanthomonas translucens]|uniref:RHS repeat-associated core domain-containing protein n=1 Tax=Xanthomonas campestris pv. translucens TaxID=343 RepID=UPI00272D8F92|nr:RHS repeat-associated core domain-containing protein [Xanthomonas translucens]WLA11449.1 DUF6531 domain-containing protein [Xanthomonas translucens]